MEEDKILHYDLTKEKRENITIDYRNSNYKEVIITFPELSNKSVRLLQDFHLGKGGIFWDGSYFITSYIINNVINRNKNIKNVIELGAGTSLPSLTLLISYELNVVTTDIPKLQKFIKDIFELNKDNFNKKSKSFLINLSWENKEDIKSVKDINNNKPYDLIIGSELIYLDDLFDDLINVLNDLSDERTYIILSYKIRLPSMVDDFMTKINKFYNVEFINYELKNNLYPKPDKLQLIRLIKKNE